MAVTLQPHYLGALFERCRRPRNRAVWLVQPQQRDKSRMCGRYLIISSPEAFRRLFGYPEQPNFPPRYNVAPTQPIPIVRVVEGQRQFALVRWGLIPPWVKDPRKFTLADQCARRIGERQAGLPQCHAPAPLPGSRPTASTSGRIEGGRKRPYLRAAEGRRADRLRRAVGNLDRTERRGDWRPPPSSPRNASRELAVLHERMPVIVPPDAFDFWLDCRNVDATTAAALLAPAARRTARRLRGFARGQSRGQRRAGIDRAGLESAARAAAPAARAKRDAARARQDARKKPKKDERPVRRCFEARSARRRAR